MRSANRHWRTCTWSLMRSSTRCYQHPPIDLGGVAPLVRMSCLSSAISCHPCTWSWVNLRVRLSYHPHPLRLSTENMCLRFVAFSVLLILLSCCFAHFFQEREKLHLLETCVTQWKAKIEEVLATDPDNLLKQGLSSSLKELSKLSFKSHGCFVLFWLCFFCLNRTSP